MNKGCVIIIVAIFLFALTISIVSGDWSVFLAAIIAAIFLFFIAGPDDRNRYTK